MRLQAISSSRSLLTGGGRNRPMMLSSVALMAARVAASGLGFVGWLVAARLFAPADVGLASAAVAGMMLCVQVALLGIGSALIAAYPQHAARPRRLLGTAAGVVTLTSLAAGAFFVLLAGVALGALEVLVTHPVQGALFVAMTVFGTLNTFYDYVSIALRRGDQVLVRNVAFGTVTVAALLLLPLVGLASGTVPILLAWTLSGLVACLIAVVQLSRALPRDRGSPAFDRRVAGELARQGVPNWLLSVAERGPALLMPIFVTELLSAETNAYWYAVWMMAWVVMIIPISMGQSLFAEASHRPRDLREVTTHALRAALVLGSLSALCVAIAAGVVLSLLGQAYASAGETALRILVFTVIPFSVLQSYYAICRARRRLAEAIATGVVVGAAAIAAALAAGAVGGLPAMAAAWLSVQLLAAGWAVARLVALLSGQAATGTVRSDSTPTLPAGAP